MPLTRAGAALGISHRNYHDSIMIFQLVYVKISFPKNAIFWRTRCLTRGTVFRRGSPAARRDQRA